MKNSSRLYFIDAMRAWAILMMLQGHFIGSLLDYSYRDPSDLAFMIWQYNRKITAPTFFTVAGFIFMYLLVRQKERTGWDNPRVRKGIKRGLALIGLGYILRLNFEGLFLKSTINESFYQVSVLHCIGVSLLLLILIYLVSYRRMKYLMPLMLLSITAILFALFPLYYGLDFTVLPKMLANFFTRSNGSVFTIFPWFGYASFGAFMAVMFVNYKQKKNLYPIAIGSCLGIGFLFIFLFSTPYLSNNLFSWLGNVLVLFAIFMLCRNILTSGTVIGIGQNTLSIYVIHYIVLYGSIFGLSFQLFRHSLSPYIVIPGALLFMIMVSYLSFQYNTVKQAIKKKIHRYNTSTG
ncbi:heparan-alpha-glucosaminide N-acetyltransferase domain-containing protein [Sinomicrobium sp. M5D2P17]